MKLVEQAQPCPACEGCGWTICIRPACCGNTYSSGECKGDCAVPEQYQEQCSHCYGSGEIPAESRKLIESELETE